MPRVRVLHWKAAEAADLLAKLRAAGFEADYDERFDPKVFRAVRASPPDAFVIDLSRLPARGREVAVFLRGKQATRYVPIVFVDGDPEKVDGVRKLLPDAVYTAPGRLRTALREAIARRPANPVVPEQMMARYAKRTAVQKLGIREGMTAAVIDPPRDYVRVIGDLPDGAVLEEDAEAERPVTLWFVQDATACSGALPEMRRTAARSKLWILWRKGSSVTQPWLRESAAAVGLVDYKICAVDAAWSGMLFARAREKC